MTQLSARRPLSVSVARIAAGVQAAIAVPAAAFGLFLLATGYAGHVDHDAGAFADIGWFLGLYLTVPALLVLLLIGLPTLLLGSPRRTAAITLLVGEGLVLLTLTASAPETFRSVSYDPRPSLVWLSIALVTGAVILGLTRRQARAWFAERVSVTH